MNIRPGHIGFVVKIDRCRTRAEGDGAPRQCLQNSQKADCRENEARRRKRFHLHMSQRKTLSSSFGRKPLRCAPVIVKT